jgi:hypothetical protein
MHRERAAIGKKKRKNQLILIGIIAAVVIAAGVGLYGYAQNPPSTAKFGPVGSAHEHAAMKLFVNNVEPVDFSQSQFQVKHRLIHFEDNNAVIIHRHATNIHLGFFFETLGMKFNSQCITLPNGTSYCNEGDKTLKFYVNGVRNDMYDKYVPEDGDLILISYGSETEDQIKQQLNTLGLVSVPTGQQ